MVCPGFEPLPKVVALSSAKVTRSVGLLDQVGVAIATLHPKLTQVRVVRMHLCALITFE